MLKLTVTLIAVCLIASTEQRGFGKPWGKPNKFSCDSDNLPDFAAKIGNKCDMEDKVDAVLAKMAPENAAAAENLLNGFKELSHDLFGSSFDKVENEQAALFTEMQQKDSNGYAKLQEIKALYDAAVDVECEDKAAAMTEFKNALNADGKKIMNKVFCNVMKNFKKDSRNTFKNYFVSNMGVIMNLKTNEGENFSELMKLFKKEVKKSM